MPDYDFLIHLRRKTSLTLSVKDSPNRCVEVENSIFLISLDAFRLNKEEITNRNEIPKFSILNFKFSIFLILQQPFLSPLKAQHRSDCPFAAD